MRKLAVVLTLGVGSLVLASAQASPVTPGAMTSAVGELGGIEAVHCTPGKNHHLPTWNYRRDGCKRPSRSKAPAKKAPAAKAPPPKSS
ncbi:MAG: hypothetical protein K2Y71_05675 [Xanthobacteraceae bacterium]|nr:hypothetical protein [Xanthobacteraceae bacterium]